MHPHLATITTAATQLAGLDLADWPPSDLAAHVLDFQRVVDTVAVSFARTLAVADEAGVWSGSGHRGLPAWLASKGKTTFSDVRRSLQLAGVLNKSLEVAAAVADGRLSAATATALEPAVTATADRVPVADLVDSCAGATPTDAATAGKKWIEMNPDPDSTPEQRARERRKSSRLSFRDVGDGTSSITGLLPTLEARILKNSLEHLLSRHKAEGDDRTYEQKLAEALVELADAYNKGAVTGGRERPTILVTIDLDVLEGRTLGVGYTSKGDVLPADVVRAMVENANLQRVLLADSLPIDVGRSQRLATDAQFRALVARDGGCRFGCNMPPEWCEVDHVKEWEHGGETNLDMLVLLCWFHHTFRHRKDVKVFGDANNLSMELPDGTVISLPATGPASRAKRRSRAAQLGDQLVA